MRLPLSWRLALSARSSWSVALYSPCMAFEKPPATSTAWLLDPQLRAAIARVAERNDLAPRWLNDAAAAYLPATLEEADCRTLLDRPSLRALGAPLDQVFLMKVFASRATDTADIEVMWDSCTFESPEAAAQAFYEAYPHEEVDPFLADHIRGSSRTVEG